MENNHPLQLSNSALEPDARGYRLALFLTGNAEAAGEILKAVFAVAAEELPQLRSKERRKIWFIRQMRTRAAKWLRENAAQVESTEPSSFPGRVAGLPEPARSAFLLFHISDCTQDEAAHLLGIGSSTFTEALAQARQLLAPGTAFPENARLRIHRPWGGDQSKVAKAVQAAKENPELAAQVAADQQWHEAIEAVTLPDELALLHWIEPPKPRLRAMIFHPAVLAIALALIVVVGVVIYMAETHMGDFDGKEEVMSFVEDAGLLNGSEFESIAPTDAEKLDDWFVMKGFEGFSVPPELQKAKAVGCRVQNHKGISVAQVALDKQNAMLLVFHTTDVKMGREDAGWQPAFEEDVQEDKWAVATYIGKQNVCVVMFLGDSDDMPEFLKTVGK